MCLGNGQALKSGFVGLSQEFFNSSEKCPLNIRRQRSIEIIYISILMYIFVISQKMIQEFSRILLRKLISHRLSIAVKCFRSFRAIYFGPDRVKYIITTRFLSLVALVSLITIQIFPFT